MRLTILQEELDKHPSDGMEVVKYIAFGMGCDGVCISGSCKVIRNNLTFLTSAHTIQQDREFW